MDQIGHHEMLESLSQGSGKKTPSSLGSHPSKKSSSSSSRKQSGNGSTASPSSAVVNEAYRRQGLRLSYLAHGEESAPPPTLYAIHPSSSTAFDAVSLDPPPSSLPSPPPPPPPRSSSILRVLIFEATHSFRRWEDEAKQQKASPGSTRRKKGVSVDLEVSEGLSELSLHQDEKVDRFDHDLPSPWRASKGRSSGEMRPSKGLLSAVLEGHSDSNTSASGHHTGARSTHTSPSQSISTKDSRTVFSSSLTGGTGGGENHAGGSGSANTGSLDRESSTQEDTPTDTALQRGACLTVPSQPTSNAGLDNVEGNLILHENDIIKVPRKSIHTFVAKDRMRKHSNTFRVQKLLGQGTFAQVFQCLHEETGQAVAIKIVKSKPAYTRQATVEIDVFRVLSEENKKKSNEEGKRDDSEQTGSPKDYMVNMICYFMHRSHLCLVFQLLGLNLYEVLKQRQFRGLPLTMVRSMVRQSLLGIRELSQRSIVHCDLKPENILVATDDAVKTIVESGEINQKPSVQQSSEKVETSTTKTTSDNSAGQSSTSVSDNSREASDNSRVTSENSGADTIVAANRKTAEAKLDRAVKLIDFGSACFEGYTAHTYIQSRFYRSPEVILGLPYDSAIDMWSLGCVAAELLLGLPVLPGVHEHDQLCRIEEMIEKIPDWMLDQGSKACKYYVKFVARPSTATSTGGGDTSSSSLSMTPIPTPTPPLPQWRIKTLQEYIRALSQVDIDKKGGLAKLSKPPGNRYFRKKTLLEILQLHSANVAEEESVLMISFTHFLYGLLDPDPWKRWTAFQAAQHPFITGQLSLLTKKSDETPPLDPKETNLANLVMEYYWKAPWDPAICRRKLLNVQKMREKQQAMRRSLASRSPTSDLSRRTRRTEPSTIASQSSRRQPSSSYGSSPPGFLASANKADGGTAGKVVDAIPQFAGSSSMSSIGRIGDAGLYVDGSTAGPSYDNDSRQGPQSYTSGVYEPGQQYADVDFAYALQRPGVVPANSAQGSYTSSVHMSEYMSQGSSVASSTAYPQQYGRRSPQSFAGIGYRDESVPFPSTPGYASTTHIGPEYGYVRQGSQYGGSSVASSASSVTTDTSFYISSQPMQTSSVSQTTHFVGEQPASMSQFQQQLPMQAASVPSQSRFGMKQGGPMLMQQQQQAPVVTQVQAPDGGFYFVMTSPTGQAMLLQPVVSQQMPMYGGQSQGLGQNQQFQGQPGGMQFIPQQSMQYAQPMQMQPAPMAPMQMQSGQFAMPQNQAFQSGASFNSSNSMNQPQQQQFQSHSQVFQPPMQQQQQWQQQQPPQFYESPMQQQQQFGYPQGMDRSGGPHKTGTSRSMK